MTNVLVIDDEAPIRLLCRVNLEAEGMKVAEAADGPSGLEKARANPPDVILLDVMMPGLDGWRVAEQLVELGLATQREADERRLQRQGGERADGQPGAVGLELDRDDGDSRGEGAHDLTQLVAADHAAEASACGRARRRTNRASRSSRVRG